MKVFDLRHRWGPPDQRGARIWRTCSACGRTESMEILLGDSLLDAITDQIRKPNPYRALLEAVR